MDRSAVIDSLRDCFAGRRDVVAAYLFGSVARGDARPDSDVDVAVMLAAGEPADTAGYDALFAMQDDLEERLHRRVDLVAMNGAPLDLLHRVLRDGVRLVDNDPERRAEFELRRASVIGRRSGDRARGPGDEPRRLRRVRAVDPGSPRRAARLKGVACRRWSRRPASAEAAPFRCRQPLQSAAR